MAEVINMPRLSDTMEEGTVASWLKSVGDAVEEGDILAEIETDKATMEFESFQSGTLLYVGLQEGESAKVDALLAIIGPKGIDVSEIAKNFKVNTGSDNISAKIETKAETTVDQKNQTIEKPATSSVSDSSNTRLFVSPLAKKMAEEKGYNLSQIQGSGENGRIVKRDVENYTPGASLQTSSAPVAKFVPSGEENFDEIKHSQMRKVIAKRLGESKFSAPHYYLNVEFDMENAIAFRAQFNSIPDTKISYNDMIVKACALALRQHPQVNSQWFDDKMRLNNHVHIGVAVAVEDGLVVPVVRFANEQTLPQIGSAVKDFAGRARNKKLTPQEMEGSTFTISNVGTFGSLMGTPIINQPEVAILALGIIKKRAEVLETKNGDEIAIRSMMYLSLSFDHRVVDGHLGGSFLRRVADYFEQFDVDRKI